MRYKITEHAPSNKRQYVFAVGKYDIEILYGLVLNASAGVPQIKETVDMRHRLKSMVKALAQALAEAESLGDDGGRKKV